jgi:AcrR family transcriptional regulator
MQKTDTRERLLDTALTLISEKGYLGTTTREIAFRAGVTEITLFRHFGSKENLFQSILNQYTFLPRLKEMLPDIEGKNLREALCEVGETFFETLQERRQLVRIMLSEINVYPEKVRSLHHDFVEEIIATLAGFFRKKQQEGIVNDIRAETIARGFLGMIFSYFQKEEILYGKVVKKRQMKQVVEEYVRLILGGIGITGRSDM